MAGVGHPVARVCRVDRPEEVAAGTTRRGRPPEITTGELTAVTQSVGLVEEHDHTAVAESQLAQLAEQALHLHHADTEEHRPERTWVDEDVGLARLAGDRLRDQGLAGAGRTPQQDASGHVAATAFDLLGLLQMEDRLLDPGQDVVLAPDVGEPGLDVLGEVDVHAAAGEKPEDHYELADREQHEQEDLEHERDRVPDVAGDGHDSVEDGVVADPGVDEGEDRESRHPFQGSAHAVAVPVVEPEQATLEAAEDPIGPEDVVGRGPLADEHVHLVDDFDRDQREQPPARRRLFAHGVGPAHDRVVRHGRGHHEPEQRREQDEELHPVPQDQRPAHRPGRLRRRRIDGADRERLHGRLRGRGLIHDLQSQVIGLIVNDV